MTLGRSWKTILSFLGFVFHFQGRAVKLPGIMESLTLGFLSILKHFEGGAKSTTRLRKMRISFRLNIKHARRDPYEQPALLDNDVCSERL